MAPPGSRRVNREGPAVDQLDSYLSVCLLGLTREAAVEARFTAPATFPMIWVPMSGGTTPSLLDCSLRSSPKYLARRPAGVAVRVANTVQMTGLDIISGSSRGLAVPKGVPADIFKKLETAVENAVNDPEYVAHAKKSFVPLNYLTGAQYQALIERIEKDLQALWAESPWR